MDIMYYPNVPQDDLQDVMEMTKKMEDFIGETLREAEISLAMSALMNATINSMISQCETVNEAMMYKTLLTTFYDAAIRAMKITGS